MVGIQYPLKDGDADTEQQPFVGKIRPTTDKFIAVLSKNMTDDYCESPVDDITKNTCADMKKRGWKYPGQYQLSINDKDGLYFIGGSHDTYEYHSRLSGTFYLYGAASKGFAFFKATGGA